MAKSKNSINTNLVSADRLSAMQLHLNRKDPAKVTTCIVVAFKDPTTGKKLRQRGCSAVHLNETEAVKAIDVLLAKALSLGWVPKKRTVSVKTDSFDASNLPAPKPRLVAAAPKVEAPAPAPAPLLNLIGCLDHPAPAPAPKAAKAAKHGKQTVSA